MVKSWRSLGPATPGRAHGEGHQRALAQSFFGLVAPAYSWTLLAFLPGLVGRVAIEWLVEQPLHVLQPTQKDSLPFTHVLRWGEERLRPEIP